MMAKPAGAACNLRCKYCYYTEKSGLTPGSKRPFMSDATLEEFIRQYIAASQYDEVQFTWHGGEATLRPVEFYRKAMQLQQKWAMGKSITNCLQTNGLQLTDEWCRFLRDNNWLVGISIDGPEDFHDEYRVTGDGKPTFQRVLKGIRMLERHGVEWNALAVVNDYNVDYPDEFYDFFKQIGCKYLQFTPIVERKGADGRLLSGIESGGEITDESVTPEQWGNFLCRVFDKWVKEDVGKIYVQLFDSTLAGYVGVPPGVCTMGATCGHAGVVEHNGDVYSCDHFVFEEHRLGNIHVQTIMEMMDSAKQKDFAAIKSNEAPLRCLECRYWELCHGECPRTRFLNPEAAEKPEPTPADFTGRGGVSYLCEGYRRFFEHTERHFRFMADCLRNELPPSLVMDNLEFGII